MAKTDEAGALGAAWQAAAVAALSLPVMPDRERKALDPDDPLTDLILAAHQCLKAGANPGRLPFLSDTKEMGNSHLHPESHTI